MSLADITFTSPQMQAIADKVYAGKRISDEDAVWLFDEALGIDS